MSKRSYNPIIHLEGFIVGIFQHHRDKGVSMNASNKRTIQNVYEALAQIYKKSDKRNLNMTHHLTSMDQFILQYGIELTKRAEEAKKKGIAPTPEVIEALAQLKKLRNEFATTVQTIEKLGDQYE